MGRQVGSLDQRCEIAGLACGRCELHQIGPPARPLDLPRLVVVADVGKPLDIAQPAPLAGLLELFIEAWWVPPRTD